VDLTRKALDSDSPTLAWHAVYTRYQHEKVAARNLEQKKFEVFLPLLTTTHRWKDRAKNLSLPLFPCYVFLRGGLDQRISLLSTPGVRAIVTAAGRPAVIRDEEIEAVRQAIESKARIEPVAYMQAGDRVRVIRGPLQGIEGVLVRTREGASRLVLSVELLRRSVAVEVEVSAVEPVRPWAGQTSRALRQ
jgi:transcription antitermination factor NusG